MTFGATVTISRAEYDDLMRARREFTDFVVDQVAACGPAGLTLDDLWKRLPDMPYETLRSVAEDGVRAGRIERCERPGWRIRYRELEAPVQCSLW